MWLKRFSNRQKLVLLCFLIYIVYGAQRQVNYTSTISSPRTADLSSLIRDEKNITKLKQLNDQINAQINSISPSDTNIAINENGHEIKPDLGINREHMEVPEGHGQLNLHEAINQDQQDDPEDKLQKMENAVERVHEEQSRRRSVAGTVIVTRI
jgi:hypothetical protein